MSYDPNTGMFNLSITSPMILTHASADAVARRVHDEVSAYLVNDPDFKILVAEGVREAICRLNIAEVVQVAVQQVLGELKKGTPPSQDAPGTQQEARTAPRT